MWVSRFSRWTGGRECSKGRTQAGWQAEWLGCVFWALVSILFKLGPWPQTSRKPFITPSREGNVGKNQADHVAPSLAAEPWPAPCVLSCRLHAQATPTARTNSLHTRAAVTRSVLFHLWARVRVDFQSENSMFLISTATEILNENRYLQMIESQMSVWKV